MATYNGAKYLQAQLDSFIEQSRQPDELIISDDGSTDGTLQIVEEFCAIAPFEVRVLTGQENLGYAGNFNRVLQASTGDLVFPSDQDDVWYPNKIERMASFMEDHPEFQVVLCDAALTDHDLNPVGVTKLDQVRSARLPMSFFVMGCCVCVRRGFLDLVLPVPENFPAHDVWFVRIAEGLGVKTIIREVLQHYRRHGENTSTYITSELRPASLKRFLWSEVVSSFQPRNARARKMENMLEQERLMLFGVDRMCQRSEGEMTEGVLAFQSVIRRRIKAYEARTRLCQKPFYKRVPVAIKLWGRGDYSAVGGFKGIVGDVFFP